MWLSGCFVGEFLLSEVSSLEKQTLFGILDKLDRIVILDSKLEEIENNQKPLILKDKELEDLNKSQLQINILKQNITQQGLNVKISPGNKGKLNVKIDGETISNLEGTGLQKINVAYPEYGEVDIIAKIDKISEMQSEIITNEAKINSILELHKINNILNLMNFIKIKNH